MSDPPKPDPPRRPRLPDVQPPKLYHTGAALRRGYPLGPAQTREEEELKEVLSGPPPQDDDGPGTTMLHFGPLPKPEP